LPDRLVVPQENSNKRSLIEALSQPAHRQDKRDLEAQRKKFKAATGGADEEEDEDLMVQANAP